MGYFPVLNPYPSEVTDFSETTSNENNLLISEKSETVSEIWPLVVGYPQYRHQRDCILRAGIDLMIVEHLSELFPEIEDDVSYHINNINNIYYYCSVLLFFVIRNNNFYHCY